MIICVILNIFYKSILINTETTFVFLIKSETVIGPSEKFGPESSDMEI